MEARLRIWTDSSAAIGICGRQGLGKLRHVDTRSLWLQQKLRDGTLEVRKVRGDVNPADVFTKHLPCEQKVHDLLRLLGCYYRGGRAAGAPQLRREGGVGESILVADSLYDIEGMSIERDGFKYPMVEYEHTDGVREALPEA